MLGLKSFETAAIVISGIELAEKIKKGQFKMGKLRGRRAMRQEIWQATLAADQYRIKAAIATDIVATPNLHQNRFS